MYDGREECSLPVVRAEQLEALVAQEVREPASNRPLLEASVRVAQQERDATHGGKLAAVRAKQAELAKLKVQQANVVKFIKEASASPKELVTELDSLRDEIGRVETELQEIEQALDVAPAVDLGKVEDYLKFFDTVYELMSDEDKRALLKTFVQKVACYEDKVHVYLYDEPSENDLKALTTEGQVCSIVQKSSPEATNRKTVHDKTRQFTSIDASWRHEIPVSVTRTAHGKHLFAKCSPTTAQPKDASVIEVARELQRMLDAGEAKNRADVARQLGITRARATQLLNLQRLPKTIQDELLQTNDYSNRVKERHLRALTRVNSAEQHERFRRLVQEHAPNGAKGTYAR